MMVAKTTRWSEEDSARTEGLTVELGGTRRGRVVGGGKGFHSASGCCFARLSCIMIPTPPASYSPASESLILAQRREDLRRNDSDNASLVTDTAAATAFPGVFQATAAADGGPTEAWHFAAGTAAQAA
eukprot:2949374-Rhodomonas_salina.1